MHVQRMLLYADDRIIKIHKCDGRKSKNKNWMRITALHEYTA
jgi:hypothetical protein